MEVRLLPAGLIREELNQYQLPLNPHQNLSQKAMSGCLVRLHHLRSKLLMIRQSKNDEQRKQNAGGMASSGSSSKGKLHIILEKMISPVLLWLGLDWGQALFVLYGIAVTQLSEEEYTDPARHWKSAVSAVHTALYPVGLAIICQEHR